MLFAKSQRLNISTVKFAAQIQNLIATKCAFDIWYDEETKY